MNANFDFNFETSNVDNASKPVDFFSMTNTAP